MGAPTPSASFTGQQKKLWEIYTDALAALNHKLDRCLKEEANIKLAEYRILAALMVSASTPDSAPDSVVRMRDLAHATRVSASRLTYQINVLAENGWVTKVQVPDDRRGKGVSITQLGRQVYRGAEPVYTREVQHAVFSDFDPRAAGAVTEFSRSILDRVEQHTKR